MNRRVASSLIFLFGLLLALGQTSRAVEYPHPPADPQKTGWPLSDAEKAFVLKPEYERRPGREMNKHLPAMWPVVPSAGFWNGTTWLDTHAKLVAHVAERKGAVDVLLVGDSITQQWGSPLDGKLLNAGWQKHLGKYSAVNIGIGGDKSQNVLWRLDHGGVAGLEPRAVVLMIGNNNMFFTPETGIEAAARGVEMCAKNLREKFPAAPLIVVKILPAHAPGVPFYEDINKTNVALDTLKLETDEKIRVLDLTADFTNADGSLKKELFTPDNIHLSPAGYDVYAARLKPMLEVALSAKPGPATKPSLKAETPAPRPMTFAAYYCWYHDGKHPTRAWQNWTSKTSNTLDSSLKAQRPGEPPPSSAARPLIGPYDSGNPEVAEWHVRLAQSAGIDAFLVDWWDTANQLDQNVDRGIVKACEKRGMKFALLDERAQFHDRKKPADYQAMLIRALRRYKESPSYLKIDGRPAVYLYQIAQSPGLTAHEFVTLRQAVEKEVGPVYWIVDKIAHDGVAAKAGDKDREKRIPADWLATPGIDSFGFYGTFSNFRAHEYDDLAGKYRYLTKLAHDAGKKMLLPVHPGHDNSYAFAESYVMPRRDGQTLKDYLRAATDAVADYILITSWNEWPETTVIEPSSSWADPYLYLKIVAEWKGRRFETPALPVAPATEKQPETRVEARAATPATSQPAAGPIVYPYAPYNEGKCDPQLVGWPLTDAETAWVSKPEYSRKPGHEASKHLPTMWPVTPTASHWAAKSGDGNDWLNHHATLVDKVRQCKDGIDVVLLGDSITQGWGGGWDGSPVNAVWKKHFEKYKTVNLGIGGDRTEAILWRLDHGALDGASPKVIVLMIGVNNAPLVNANGVPAEAVAEGIQLCVRNLRSRCPQAQIILTKILPAFPPKTPVHRDVIRINQAVEALKLDADERVHLLDLAADFTNTDGSLKAELYSDQHLHLNAAGYEIWAAKLKPMVEKLAN